MANAQFLLWRVLAGIFVVVAFASAFVIPPEASSPLQRRRSSSTAVRRIPIVWGRNDAQSFLSAEMGDRDGDGDGGAPTEDTGPKNDGTSRNEFSRTIRVSRWFNGGDGGRGSRRRRMDLSISASESERRALASRFRLTNITALSADMVIRPALGGATGGGGGGGRGGGSDVGGECIEASGTVCAKVTQTCVRTNEEFDVDLEFSFDTVLKAMNALSAPGGVGGNNEPTLSAGEMAALEAASKLASGEPRKKKGGKKQKGGKVKGVSGGRQQSIDDMGMKQLSDILMEYEVTDDIIEDECCFCTDGIVDCGEIVAQMFRSKLDPYPKKPGTDPISYSFTF